MSRRSSRLAAPATAPPAAAAAATGAPAVAVTKTIPAPKKPASRVQQVRNVPAPNANSVLSVVDPAANLSANAVIMPGGYDVLLTRVDVAKNIDKYYLIQAIHDGSNYYVFTRWGRTGSSGASIVDKKATAVEAETAFKDKFKEKTGVDWDTSDPEDRYNSPADMYSLMRRSTTIVSSATWEYWVDDKVDGKADGWYPYDASAGAKVEEIWMQAAANPALALNSRLVESGYFTYLVDLTAMMQTNHTHPAHKTRYIRRNPGGLDNLPPSSAGTSSLTASFAAATAAAAAAAVPSHTNNANNTSKRTRNGKAAKAASSGNAAGKKAVAAAAASGPGGEEDGSVNSASDNGEQEAAAAPPKKKGSAATAATKGKKAAANSATSAAAAPQTPARAPAVTPAVTAVSVAAAAAAVDQHCPLSGASVVKPYDAMLNQTDIKTNANKFYLLQMLQDSAGVYHVWTRWGRCGESIKPSENQMLGPYDKQSDALKVFSKKFQDKTGHKWSNYVDGNFSPKPGKYEPLETEINASGPPLNGFVTSAEAAGADVAPTKLDAATLRLVNLIFSDEMFQGSMKRMNVDLTKMPLGQLSATQVQRGYDALQALEEAVNDGAAAEELVVLSSRFYQVVPHAFGRRERPPTISTQDVINEKYEMLNTLGDIAKAQGMMAIATTKPGTATTQQVPHPADLKYAQLNAELTLVTPASKDFAIVSKYVAATAVSYNPPRVLHVWSADRAGEASRFQKYTGLTNHRLLWHGTDVAVVAAILQSGLRIMPHSGGRVGRGIYLASENAKSYQYVRGAHEGMPNDSGDVYASSAPRSSTPTLGIMFLAQAALGREATITEDDPTLTKPPTGFDSVVARGRIEPDPVGDVSITLDGVTVAVPQAKPKPVAQFQNSFFSNSEYLLYQEEQARLRYVVLLEL